MINATHELAIRDSALFAPEGQIRITTPGPMTLSQSSTQELRKNLLPIANLGSDAR